MRRTTLLASSANTFQHCKNLAQFYVMVVVQHVDKNVLLYGTLNFVEQLIVKTFQHYCIISISNKNQA